MQKPVFLMKHLIYPKDAMFIDRLRHYLSYSTGKPGLLILIQHPEHATGVNKNVCCHRNL